MASKKSIKRKSLKSSKKLKNSSKTKCSKKRHSKFVKSFTRKDGVYVKAHYRCVGGKRT
jgi:hypothetical protein